MLSVSMSSTPHHKSQSDLSTNLSPIHNIKHLTNRYFWAGNEITFLTPFLFNYGSQCHRTQYWSRKVVDMHFANTPAGG